MYVIKFLFFLQSSGVRVQPVCVEIFTKIKLGHEYRYIIYALTPDLKEITVHKTAPPCKLYRLFLMKRNFPSCMRELDNPDIGRALGYVDVLMIGQSTQGLSF